MEEQNNFLEGLFNRFPDTYLMFIDRQVGNHWGAWKKFNDCSAEEKAQANLRQIFPNEIVLDIDAPEEYTKILELIKADSLKYYAYSTGSRGYHIHLFYDNLDALDISVRNKIRKLIIKKYGADEAKSSEQGIVAYENRPHFKTGTLKTSLANNLGRNILSDALIEKTKEETLREISILRELQQDASEQFRDFHTKDKLFLYFLSGAVPESQRKNDVLFKNFAVALVNEGLSVEEIKNIIDPVLKTHYKDKKWHEFYGWVLKAIKKELLDYNIFELNEWSRKFGHEVFYAEISQTENIINALTIPQLYDALWNENIVGQPIWAKMCMYNLIGCVLNEEKEDLRVHIMFSCFTSTGKDEGLNIVESLLSDLDFEVGTFSTITDRTLVGAVNAILKAQNDKYGLFKAGDKITVKGKDYEYINPIEYGLLKTYHWIGFPEAESVLRPGAHNTNLQLLLRQVMDKKREVNKGVSGSSIKFRTNTTLALATFPIEKITSTLFTNGLFQRMLFYHKPMSKALHKQILDKSIKRVLYDTPKNKAYKNALILKLKGLKEFWANNKEAYLADFEKKSKCLEPYLAMKISNIQKKYSHLDINNQSIIDAILRRGLTSVVKKLIILDDLINDKNVTSKNVDRAIELFGLCLESATQLVWENRGRKTYIEDEEKLDKNLIAIINHLKTEGNNNSLEVSRLASLIMEKQGKGRSSALTWIDRAEEEQVIKRVKEPKPGNPNRTMIYLNESFLGETSIEIKPISIELTFNSEKVDDSQ